MRLLRCLASKLVFTLLMLEVRVVLRQSGTQYIEKVDRENFHTETS